MEVKCVDASGYAHGWITEGKVYDAIEGTKDNYYIEYDNGMKGNSLKRRFVEVSENYKEENMQTKEDVVNNPKHYTNHKSGVECIQITEHMGFNLGNAVKYIWRCDLKKDAIEDLKKAEFYIRREIEKREKELK